MPTSHVLVIDDDPVILKLAGSIFHKAGFKVSTANSGRDGLKAISTAKPDLILLDIVMPELDGVAVLKRLRANLQTAHLPVIIMSAASEDEDKLQGFDAGADDYVTKPIKARELLARTQALLRRTYQPKPARASIVAIKGVKGGVGVTSVALNVATTLAKQGKSVALVEMRPCRGSLPFSLNMTITQDLGLLLKGPAEAITRESMRRATIFHPLGFQFLAAPQLPGNYAFTPKHVDAILKHLISQVHYVILDLPPMINPAIRQALVRADQILLVAEPEIVSMACAQADLDILQRWRVYNKTSAVISTHSQSAIPLTMDEIQAQLGIHVAATIPPAGGLFQESARVGMPLVLAHPLTLPAEALQYLAGWLNQQFQPPPQFQTG